MIKKIASFILIGILTALLFETGWTFWLGAKAKMQPIKVRPIYPWSFYTLKGEHIGGHGFFLRLANHPFVQYINLPNQKLPIFTINSMGFRGKEISKEKGSKKRIVIMGGSAAFGAGAWSDEETFASHLQKLLPETEVINAAIVGHLSGNELVYLINDIVDLKPDLVIAMDGYNDVADQLYNGERDVHTLGANVTFFLVQERLVQIRFADSFNLPYRLLSCQPFIFRQIYQSYLKLIDKIMRRPATEPKLYNTNPELFKKRMQDVIDTYVKNIVKMNALSEVFGAKFVSFRQPHISSFNIKKFDYWVRNEDIKMFAEKTTARLETEKIRQINLNDPKYPYSEASFTDALHFTDEGAALTAQIAAQYIKNENLLASSAASETSPAA
jgi:lysophospholipase L1-like esterase